MGKVVINDSYGGFDISKTAYDWLKEHGMSEKLIDCVEDTLGFQEDLVYCNYYGPRHHPLLIQCVEELGNKASGYFADLIVVEFDGDLYRITDYDGKESIEIPTTQFWNNVNDY